MGFNKDVFLDFLCCHVESLGVELASSRTPSITREDKNPQECYKICLYGHTPDYPEVNDLQPPYSFTAYAYPAQKTIYINYNYNGDWWDILFPSCLGLTPIEHGLKTRGVRYLNEDWRVVLE
ncbi:hypothetical protein [Aeromonas veronii]|uniref:hypothetical protein n=1 Tax=Aeromonas veronii TaxID=654 RepID=UPI0011328529|nr:hypothetical protein [Aeromonas veronii]